MEIRVLSSKLERLVPDQTVRAQFRSEVELDEGAFAFIVDESPGVNAEALHHPERPGDGAVGQNPHRHGGGLRAETHPVPRIVVSGLRLRNFVMRLGLEGVDKIGKLNRILDEEDGNIVTHAVPYAFVGIELDCEASNVPDGICTSSRTRNGTETQKDRCLPGSVGQEAGLGQLRNGGVKLEGTVSGGSPSVNWVKVAKKSVNTRIATANASNLPIRSGIRS